MCIISTNSAAGGESAWLSVTGTQTKHNEKNEQFFGYTYSAEVCLRSKNEKIYECILYVINVLI